MPVARYYCPRCHYELTHAPIGEGGIGTCPECGLGFEEGDTFNLLTKPPEAGGRWFVFALVAAGVIIPLLTAFLKWSL